MEPESIAFAETIVGGKTGGKQFLMILVHGLDGNEGDFLPFKSMVEPVFSSPSKIVISTANTGFLQTYYGVREGGRRLYNEILNSIDDSILPGTQLVIIAHSLGGIYSRYAIGLMHDTLESTAPESAEAKAKLSKLVLSAFTTMCTPHLGVRKSGGSVIKDMWKAAFHSVAPYVVGRTGRDLLLLDEEGNVSNDSVLVEMAIADSKFMKGLKRFSHHTLVTMSDHDLMVPYSTAAISNHSPWMKEAYTPNFGWSVLAFSGFSESHLEKAFKKVKTLPAGDGDHMDHLSVGKDTPVYPLSDDMETDTHRELEFHRGMYNALHSINWRRIELAVHIPSPLHKPLAHTFVINKMQPAGTRSEEFTNLLLDIMRTDFDI